MKPTIHNVIFAKHRNWIITLLITVAVLASLLYFGAFFLSEQIIRRDVKLTSGFSVGEIAAKNVISNQNVEYIDAEATEELQRRAVAGIKPVYSYMIDETLTAVKSFQLFSDLVLGSTLSRSDYDQLSSYLAAAGTSPEVLQQQLSEYSGDDLRRLMNFSDNLLRDIMDTGVLTREELSANPLADASYFDIVITESDRVGDGDKQEEISRSDILTVSALPGVIAEAVSASTLDVAAEVITGIVAPFAVPNLNFDRITTYQRIQSAESSVEPVTATIAEGEYIIVKDFIVTEEALKKLSVLQSSEYEVSLPREVGKGMLALIYSLIFVLVVTRFIPNTYRKQQFFLIIMISVGLFTILQNVTASALLSNGILLFAFSIPIAFLTMLLTAIVGKSAGYLVSAFLALSALLIPQADYSAFIILITQGLTGTYIITIARKRVDMIKSFIYLLFSGFALLLVMGLITQYSFTDFYLQGILMAVNALISTILLVMLLPVCENIFNLPTDFRLIELTTMNTKTLKRMAVVARGTYSHSVSVADLAEAACEAIGANSLLARVGAYYHDIGKIDQPEYFIENQTGSNKHNELKPSLSAAVIKSHVKVGIEKAKEIGLPPEVIDILAQHHGSDVISYFYVEAMNKNEKNSKVSKEDFSYNGTLPMTKEAAVVMLADSVDAACRTIKQPTTPKLEKMVWKIFMDKINNRQLANSDLSLSELEQIKKRFILILSGRYHTRIEYPELPEGAKR